MTIIRTAGAMRRFAERCRARGRIIGFVPTMGALHEGHVTLMRRARRRCDVVAASIFVNPMQFGPGEDLARYPRDIEGDRAKCAVAGVDVIYLPDASAMYPAGFQTTVRVAEIEKGLCGDRRPGHFVGVATVVLKLFNAVRPHVAVFGEKDWQQLQVIRRMAADLDLDVRIVGVPTVRDPDGLAMSSRNAYLSAAERETAIALPRALAAAHRLFVNGVRDPAALEAAAMKILKAREGLQVEYVEARTPDLKTVMILGDSAVILGAVRVGKTRLIDNRVLGRKKPQAAPFD